MLLILHTPPSLCLHFLTAVRLLFIVGWLGVSLKLSYWFPCFWLNLFSWYNFYQVGVAFQSCNVVRLLATPWTAAHQASLSFTISWTLLKLMSIESVMPSRHLILCRPLLLLPSIFLNIRIFLSESVLRIRWPKYWSFRYSISPSNEHPGLISFRMGWWISLQSKGLSRVFSNTTVQKHQSFGPQLSLWSSSQIHTWALEKP